MARLILMYHRVASEAIDPWGLCVSPKHFTDQLDVLRQEADVVPLGKLLETCPGARRRPRVAITFDDGYADNWQAGWPALQRNDMPATVFVVSGAVGQQREFWWDELERLLLQATGFPRRLQIDLDGRQRTFDLTSEAAAANSTEQANRTWRMKDGFDPTPRHRAYRELHGLLKLLPPETQRNVLDEIAAAGRIENRARPNWLPLGHNQLSRLAASDLIEIGAHTVGHLRLSEVPPAVQTNEIRDSKTEWEELTGRAVVSFAYPYGQFSEQTLAIVRGCGFSRACAVLNAILGREAESVSTAPGKCKGLGRRHVLFETQILAPLGMSRESSAHVCPRPR